MKINKLIPIIVILAVFLGPSTVSATPTTNQTIATSFDVQNYIGIDTNTSSAYFGNTTPGTVSYVYTQLNDYSNINIDIYGIMYSDFTGPQTVSSNYVQGTVQGGTSGNFLKNSPQKLFGNWTATGSTQSKTYNLSLVTPLGALPGHYNSTLYTYAQTAS